jgi:predicted DNA-binding protein with PD1-like motif
MRWSEAKKGRVFVLRLEHGDVVHESVERFVRENAIAVARVSILGGADRGSRLVVGPANGEASPPELMLDE